MNDPNWNDLSTKPTGRPDDPAQGAIDGALYRLAQTTDGRDFIKWLRARTKDAVARHNASDAQLRELEGQRRLVDDIEKAIERGRVRGEKKPPT